MRSTKRKLKKDIRYLEEVLKRLEDDETAREGWDKAHRETDAHKSDKIQKFSLPSWIQALCRFSDNLSFHFMKWSFVYPWDW